MKLRIGELLKKNGIITEDQLQEALALQKKDKSKKLGELLIKLGYLTSTDLIWMLSEQADMPFVEVRLEMLDRNLINVYPESLLYSGCILPLYETEDKIFVALGDPMNKKAIQDIAQYTKKEIVVSGADPKKIEQILNSFFLSEQFDESIHYEELDRSTIKISAPKARIEIIDKAGGKIVKDGSIEIVVKKPERDNK